MFSAINYTATDTADLQIEMSELDNTVKFEPNSPAYREWFGEVGYRTIQQ